MRGTLVLLLLLLLPACSGGDDDGLETGRYVSESVTAEDASLFAGDEVAMKVEERDDQLFLSWQATCNTMSAPARLRDSRLVLQERVTATAMACDSQGETEQDRWLTEFYTSEPLWEGDGDGLHLQSTDGSQAITFERAADEPR